MSDLSGIIIPLRQRLAHSGGNHGPATQAHLVPLPHRARPARREENPRRRLLRRADRPRRWRTSPSPASSSHHYPDLIRGLAMVKMAAARANHDVRRRLSPRTSSAASRPPATTSSTASCTISSASTSSRAAPARRPTWPPTRSSPTRASSTWASKKGEYEYCDPHDHVNLSQSTNDAYPTALHVAMLLANDRLIAELKRLVAAFLPQEGKRVREASSRWAARSCRTRCR